MTVASTPRYLRVSLLSACNLRCTYCRPSGLRERAVIVPTGKLCSALVFLRQQGIRKIRFTGGEPTLNKELSGLVSFVKALDKNIETAITSNGVLLASLAKQLSAAGLDSANISLDTLDPSRFRMLTGSDSLNRVVAGIDAAADWIDSVKLNCVLMRGVNDGDVTGLVMFAESRGVDIRFIEFMPNRYSIPGDPRFISSREIRERLPWEMQALPHRPGSAAHYYATPSLRIRVGFISSVSHPFCAGCDRLRLTAVGQLHTCLYNSSNINLFDLLGDKRDRAEAEFVKLMRSKQIRGRRTGASAASLPSFSAVGG